MDNYTLALEKGRDTHIAELERCRSEVERFVAEVDRLTRERDEARDHAEAAHRDWLAEVDGNAELRAAYGAKPDETFFQFIGRLVRDRDDAIQRARNAEESLKGNCARTTEMEARAEAADADNASFVRALNIIENDVSEGRPDDAQREAIAAMEGEHPGAALLEERKRIAKTLDTVDVPSEADEQEMGRACDLAGRVALLASWGQRGWREYRKTKDSEAALLERLRAAEKVVEAARAFRSVVEMNFDVHREPEHMPLPLTVTVKHGDALLAAFVAYDAAKEER